MTDPLYWGDLSIEERAATVVHLVRVEGLSYGQAAKLLTASRSAVAGALARAEGRETDETRQGRLRVTLERGKVSITKLKRLYRKPPHEAWTEARLTERWADRKARLARTRT